MLVLDKFIFMGPFGGKGGPVIALQHSVKFIAEKQILTNTDTGGRGLKADIL